MLRIPLAAVLAALLVATLALPAARPAVAQAQDGGLSIVSSTSYEVRPEERRVRVTIDAIATALTPDTTTERTFYTGITLSVQPGIVNASASSDGRPLTARVVDAAPGQTGLQINFDRDLFYQQRYPFRAAFDLVTTAGMGAGNEVRVGRTLVAFPVWAFGSRETPGSRVEVVIPADYSVQLRAGELASARAQDGSWMLRADQIGDPLTFFAYVTADRPGAYHETPLSLTVVGEPLAVVVRAWDDDPDFGERIADLMRKGMPVLGDLIGFPLGFSEPLSVEQAAGSLLGDYAGFYFDADRKIQIHYEADPFVALHEAAHAWFNDRLFGARWILEAFASYYAELAAAQLSIEIDDHGLTGDLEDGRIPLNDWGEVGREERAIENYAYAATLDLARLIAERAGLDGLRRVWAAAERGEAAYQPLATPDAEPERWSAVTQRDWQRLLDLLEERTAESYDDLWGSWVVNEDERPLLEERRMARAAYFTTAATAGEWKLPPIIRHQLGSWSFDRAGELLALVDQVLVQRSAIQDRASALGLVSSEELRMLFESGPSLGAAIERAEAELEALALLERAEVHLASELTFLEEIGLIGESPGASLDNARSAYVAGDLQATVAAAERAIVQRDAAERSGRDRVAVGGGGVLGLSGLALVAIGGVIGRGRARPTPSAP
jgi:hypothetical protein